MNLNVSIKGQFVSFAFALSRQREKEAGVKNVKIPSVVMTSRPDVMQLLWFFSTEKHRLTIKVGEGGGGQRQGQILFVWVSVEVFRFHSKQLPAWKINQRHLLRSS